MPTPPPAADSSANSRSPRSGFPAPWVEIVRRVGELPDTESTPPPLSPAKAANVLAVEGSDKEHGGNVGKNSASDQGSGGAAAAAAVSTSATVVIGGDIAWPPLSESTRPSQKASSDSSKSTPDGSVSVSQGPVTSNSQQPTQGSANGNHNSGTHNGAPAMQRLMNRGSTGGGGSRQGGFPRGPPVPPQPFPVPQTVQSSFGNLVPVDSTPREPRPAGGFASRPHAANDHRSSYRRANFGQHNRGDGRNNYRGSRRDEDHGNSHGHPQMPLPRGFMRPFAMPPHVFRPYGNAMVYPEMPHLVYYPLPPDSIRGMHYFPGVPPSHPCVSTSEPPLHLSIVKQIDYYFSDDNLVKDEYLRSNMDENGWVAITLIANFPRVQNLTKNVALILQCLNKSSSIIEVQGDKVRRRNDWMKWITSRPPSDSVIQPTVSSTDDVLSSDFQKASLDKVKQDQASNALLS